MAQHRRRQSSSYSPLWEPDVVTWLLAGWPGFCFTTTVSRPVPGPTCIRTRWIPTGSSFREKVSRSVTLTAPIWFWHVEYVEFSPPPVHLMAWCLGAGEQICCCSTVQETRPKQVRQWSDWGCGGFELEVQFHLGDLEAEDLRPTWMLGPVSRTSSSDQNCRFLLRSVLLHKWKTSPSPCQWYSQKHSFSWVVYVTSVPMFC
jgi:hypothetical protein